MDFLFFYLSLSLSLSLCLSFSLTPPTHNTHTPAHSHYTHIHKQTKISQSRQSNIKYSTYNSTLYKLFYHQQRWHICQQEQHCSSWQKLYPIHWQPESEETENWSETIKLEDEFYSAPIQEHISTFKISQRQTSVKVS